MMVLVIGGSGSGKSEYAEKMVDSLLRENEENDTAAMSETQENLMESIADDMTENRKKYYLATMQVFDEEGRKKVERHRNLRSGKGFFTIEQPTDIHRALAKMDIGERIVLLECISNLAANEMFVGAEEKLETEVSEKMIREIELLRNGTAHLVIVSNNVFEDGISYDESTMAYIRVMGYVNRKLAEMADRVVEVVVGIPIVIKERKPERNKESSARFVSSVRRNGD